MGKSAKLCAGRVWAGWSYTGCARRATTPAGFCGIHDPERDADRQAKRDAAWREKQAAKDARLLTAAVAAALPNLGRCVGEAATLAQRDEARAWARWYRETHIRSAQMEGPDGYCMCSRCKTFAALDWAREE